MRRQFWMNPANRLCSEGYFRCSIHREALRPPKACLPNCAEPTIALGWPCLRAAQERGRGSSPWIASNTSSSGSGHFHAGFRFKKSAPVQFGAKSAIFAFIDRHCGEYGIEFLCQHYAVSTSGYYAWRHRAPSARAEANHTLLERIARIHRRSHGTYGSPRVVQALRKEGLAAGEHRVARLMRAAGLKGRLVTVTRRAPGVHRFFEATDNLRVGTAPPAAMNQQWVGEVPALKANGHPCFLAAVMDGYSRRIVGWALGSDRTVDLTARAMQRAIRTPAPAQPLIFHSDRGIEYAAYRYRAILTQHGIRPSMNRPRYCQDNAHMESFFHTMKIEWIRGRTFESFAELEAALKTYIRFYNHHRLHSGIDYHTPEEYERVEA